MTTKTEALKLALKNLLVATKHLDVCPGTVQAAEEALVQPAEQVEPFNPDWASYRQGKLDGAAEALAQPEQTSEERGYVPLSDDGKSVFIDGIGEVYLSFAPPEQEPVARIGMIDEEHFADVCRKAGGNSNTPLYTSPPERKPMTKADLDLLCEQALFCRISFQQFARAIEAAHGIKEKNT